MSIPIIRHRTDLAVQYKDLNFVRCRGRNGSFTLKSIEAEDLGRGITKLSFYSSAKGKQPPIRFTASTSDLLIMLEQARAEVINAQLEVQKEKQS